jgi:hypothetical protein
LKSLLISNLSQSTNDITINVKFLEACEMTWNILLFKAFV